MQDITLSVPYFTQLDSQIPGQAPRSCFSTADAMLLAYLRPSLVSSGFLAGQNGDDNFLREVLSVGDTINPDDQLEVLARHGVTARRSTNCSWADVDKQLARWCPVPIGILHHGPVSAPFGGGHWITIIGKQGDHYVVHDPAGQLDLVNGGYHVSNNGRGLLYSAHNLGPRWMADGPSTGWAIIAEPPKTK